MRVVEGVAIGPAGCTNVEAVLVEVPSAIGPYGAKPVGEPPVIPGGAVIANAVFAATGARVSELPLTPERVRQAMQARA